MPKTSPLSESLLINGAYACRIHHGQRNDRPREATFQPGHCYYLSGLTSGVATLTSADQSSRHPAPCAFLLPPHSKVRLTCPAGSRWEHFAFDVTPVPLKKREPGDSRDHRDPQAQPSPLATWGYEPPAIVADSHLDDCLDTLRFCGRHWWISDGGWARANARLHWWVTEYAVAHLPGDGQDHTLKDPWLAKVQELAATGFDNGMTADGLARSLGISRESLRQKLAAAGTTPGNLLRQFRLARALELMGKKKMSLDDIARACGYRSVSAFSAAFRKQYGCSPGSWRKAL